MQVAFGGGCRMITRIKVDPERTGFVEVFRPKTLGFTNEGDGEVLRMYWAFIDT